MSKWQEKTNARCCRSIWRRWCGLLWPCWGPSTRWAAGADRRGQRGRLLCGHKALPTRVVRTYVPYATGSEDVDAMLNGIAANLDALHKLNEAIPDPQLSRAMDRMEKAGRSIAAVVEKTPDKARSVDRFARYYLPRSSS